MIDKETWKIQTDCGKMEKLIKYNMHEYHKNFFLKKNFQSNMKQFTIIFSWMVAFKTNLDVIGKFMWIGKMMYNIIK